MWTTNTISWIFQQRQKSGFGLKMYMIFLSHFYGKILFPLFFFSHHSWEPFDSISFTVCYIVCIYRHAIEQHDERKIVFCCWQCYIQRGSSSDIYFITYEIIDFSFSAFTNFFFVVVVICKNESQTFSLRNKGKVLFFPHSLMPACRYCKRNTFE